MMARGTKLIAAFISTCAIVCSSQTSAQEGIKIPTNLKVLAGFGSHPVSPEIASMWFASAPMPRSGIKPALMVYFRGPSGWLDPKVTYKADSNPDLRRPQNFSRQWTNRLVPIGACRKARASLACFSRWRGF
jgi:hypothetical protein